MMNLMMVYPFIKLIMTVVAAAVVGMIMTVVVVAAPAPARILQEAAGASHRSVANLYRGIAFQAI